MDKINLLIQQHQNGRCGNDKPMCDGIKHRNSTYPFLIVCHTNSYHWSPSERKTYWTIKFVEC